VVCSHLSLTWEEEAPVGDFEGINRGLGRCTRPIRIARSFDPNVDSPDVDSIALAAHLGVVADGLQSFTSHSAAD
jgi:hypothetical protein